MPAHNAKSQIESGMLLYRLTEETEAQSHQVYFSDVEQKNDLKAVDAGRMVHLLWKYVERSEPHPFCKDTVRFSAAGIPTEEAQRGFCLCRRHC